MNVLFAGIAVGVGVVGGFLAVYFVLSLWPSIIVWGLIGATFGYFSNGWKEVVLIGAVYGFFLSGSFLYFGFHGSEDEIVPMIFLALALSVIGILCGIISAAVGHFARPYLTLEPIRKYF